MSSYVPSRTFCCCLPVRFGVFLLSLLALASGGFLAAIGWIQLSQLKQHPLGKTDEISLWIQSSLFSLLALLALFGFFGAVIKSRGMVSGFAIGIAIHLGFSVAAGCFSIYTMFSRDSQPALDSCLQKANDDSDATMQACKSGLILIKAVMVVIYVFTWLIQLHAYFVVERYVDQLDEERLFDSPVMPRTMVLQVDGPPITAGFAPSYPFTDPRQRFGATGRDQGSNNMA
jgi:uncharacterized membrane protein